MNRIMNKNIKYYDNFAVFLKEIKADYANDDAVTWFDRKGNEHIKTFSDLASDARGLAAALCKRNFGGKHIAIIGENSYEWLLAYLAIVISGGIAVCIDAEQSEEVICQMVDQGDCDAVFLSETCYNICKREKVRERFLLSGEVEGNFNVRNLIDESAFDGAEIPQVDIEPGQTAAIVFTSGTTGLSKPVMLSHQALLTNGCECNVYVDGGKRAFSSLPFCHTYGMTCAVLATWARGGCLILNGSLKTVMRDMLNSDAFSLLTVPLMVEAIHNQMWMQVKQAGKEGALKKIMAFEKMKRRLGLNFPGKVLSDLRKKCVGNLKVIICGGAHMNKEVAEEFQLMGLIVLQGYGITECGPLVAVNGNQACKLGSVGMVLPSCKVKLVEEEIYVRGVNLMNGYYKMPEENQIAMEGEWFKTGDVGFIDKDGFLYITGRKKNLIVFKNGKKISPERLEDLIGRIPIVKTVMVYGATSGISADDVKLAATIFPDEDQTGHMSSYEILEELQFEIDKINNTLPLYQQIQMINIREEDFEKTSLMKIKRHTV